MDACSCDQKVGEGRLLILLWLTDGSDLEHAGDDDDDVDDVDVGSSTNASPSCTNRQLTKTRAAVSTNNVIFSIGLGKQKEQKEVKTL